MKDVEDPRLRQLKIKAIVNQFFSKGAATGVGFDGQVLREISSTPPDKVTVSMLISGRFSNSSFSSDWPVYVQLLSDRLRIFFLIEPI